MDSVPLTRERYTEAGELLARAFEADPTWRALFPNPAKRPAELKWFFTRMVRLVAPVGECYVTPDGEGVAVWFPPGRLPNMGLGPILRSGFILAPVRLGARWCHRAWQVFGDAARRQQAEVPTPHWVLDTLAVDPKHQGRGLANALLRPILDRADRDGIPCYVMTHNPKNIAFYEHFGFRILRQKTLGQDGAFVCSLERPVP